MKFSKKISLILIASILSIGAIFGQSENIINGLKQGDLSLFESQFAPEVWLCIIDQEDEYSIDETKSALSEFFKTHPVNSFKRLHNSGKQNPSTEVIIGELTSGADVFRVHVYVQKNGKQLIDELRITKN